MGAASSTSCRKRLRANGHSDLNSTYSSLMAYVHDNVIGDGIIFNGPYGKRAVVYCDYTASGRPLRCIEEYISKYVYSYYANTHTTTCITAQQTTKFRHDAKMMIKKAVNASDDDVVIFTGSGTTGAIHKLIGVLELKEHGSNTVVFISPFEHHSNILPWTECGTQVVRIQETARGALDVECLERRLQEFQVKGMKMIASFSAASNITGIMTDTAVVSELCHKYGALSFWDYATAAPYLEINMNASDLGYKDAIFASPHKFVGGPGTPGILIAKKSLFTNAVPHAGGGGTVLYVFKGKHVYVDDIESREEGGTPAIVESIRAGLCFQLKQDIGPKAIEEREEMLYKKARSVWTELPNMVILGAGSVKRLPIFSFIIRYSESGTKYLHHNFLAILLNDLFGIQARGGCACAGPYAEGLLGINGKDFTVFLEGNNITQQPEEDTNTNNSNMIMDDCAKENCTASTVTQKHLEIMKPGFVRLNLPYFMNSDEIEFIIQAVAMMSEHAWKMLPLYKFDPETGIWSHRTHRNEILNLSDVSFTHKIRAANHPKHLDVMHLDKKHFDECLSIAQEIFDQAAGASQAIDTSSDIKMEKLLPEEKNEFCWFLEPWQAAVDLVLIDTQFTTETLSNTSRTGTRQIFNPRQMSVFSQRSSSRRIIASLKRKSSKKSQDNMEVIEEEGSGSPQKLIL